MSLVVAAILAWLYGYGRVMTEDRARHVSEHTPSKAMFDDYIELLAYIRSYRTENTSVVIFNWHITHRIKAFKTKWIAANRFILSKYVGSLVNEALKKEYDISTASGKELLPHQQQSLLSFISNNN